MKVMKFGGSCLAEASDFQRVAAIVLAEEERPVLVVSAVKGVTDLLIEGIEAVLRDEAAVFSLLVDLKDRHKRVARVCAGDEGSFDRAAEKIDVLLKKLEKLLLGIAYTGEVSDSVKAHVLSYGERLCAVLLAGVLDETGQPAMAMDADAIGLLAEGSFDNATALPRESRENLCQYVLPQIGAGRVPVITGYFGSTRDGRVATFGRNGTDYSAAFIARALGASSLEIWKDVAGFLSADPRIVRDATHLRSLSFYEAAELSYFGAQILHPRTVEPVMDGRIRVVIKDVNDPKHEGTSVQRHSPVYPGVVKGVTVNMEIAVLKVHGPGVGCRPGVLAQIGQCLHTAGINIVSVITSQTCISVLVHQNDAGAGQEAVRELDEAVIDRVDRDEAAALVAVVGHGILEERGVAARVFAAVSRAHINVEMISSGASEVASYFVIRSEESDKAVRAIHAEFFPGNASDLPVARKVV